MTSQPKQPVVKTIEITNFGGRLSRIINGDLNSGLAKFSSSWGYDPFSKPGNLTWLQLPTNITGTAITDLILDMVTNSENGSLFVYALGSTGNLYKIQPNSFSSPNVDSVVGISSVKTGAQTYNYGASMQLYNYRATIAPQAASTIGKLFVAGDSQILSINTDGTGQTSIGGINGYVENIYRPTAQFAGKLIFGNGNNIGLVDATNTVISPTTNSASTYGQLNPPLPPNTYITDLDVSPDGNYLLISTTNSLNEQPTNYGNATSGNLQQANAANSYLYYWNGSDVGATAANYISNFPLISLQAYLQNNMMFVDDMFGASVSDSTQKLLTLGNNKAPFPNATGVNGNFLTWVAPELDPNGTPIYASLYYFGALDGENQPGLYRMTRYSPSLTGGNVAQVPAQELVNSNTFGLNPSASSIITLGTGKHYFSTLDVSPTNTSGKATLQSFSVTSLGTGNFQFGTYETQTQLFSKKITVKQIRFYVEPTVNQNNFLCTLIGSNGNPINNTLGSGAFNYSFTAGTDPTQVQGSLDRINFNPLTLDTYALGLRITNQGNTNMTFHKIEIDYQESGQ